MAIATTIAIFAGLSIAATAAIVFWEQVVGWAQRSLFPWFEKHLPTLAPYVREAFVVLNKAATKVRKAAIKAWRKIKLHTLQVVEKFERTSDNEYVLTITSWLRENLKDTEAVRRETEETVGIDDLPDEVADAFLRGGREYEFDVLKEQERQMKEAMKATA